MMDIGRVKIEKTETGCEISLRGDGIGLTARMSADDLFNAIEDWIFRGTEPEPESDNATV